MNVDGMKAERLFLTVFNKAGYEVVTTLEDRQRPAIAHANDFQDNRLKIDFWINWLSPDGKYTWLPIQLTCASKKSRFLKKSAQVGRLGVIAIHVIYQEILNSEESLEAGAKVVKDVEKTLSVMSNGINIRTLMTAAEALKIQAEYRSLLKEQRKHWKHPFL